MDREKLVVLALTVVGVLLAMGGALLAYFFNFEARGLDFPLRCAGLGLGVFLVFVGVHVAVAGADTLRGA